MVDFADPTIYTGYADFIADMKDQVASVAKMDFKGETNVPSGAIDWSDPTEEPEIYNGSTWAKLSFFDKLAYLAENETVTGAWGFDEATTFNDDIILTETESLIRTNSADASDDKAILITPAGAVGHSRGASISFYGNEHANTGQAIIRAGNHAAGHIRFFTSEDVEVLRVHASDYVQQLTGNYIVGNVNFRVLPDTEDGSDTKSVGLGGGGDLATNRGAHVLVCGNEHDSLPGLAMIRAGDYAAVEGLPDYQSLIIDGFGGSTVIRSGSTRFMRFDALRPNSNHHGWIRFGQGCPARDGGAISASDAVQISTTSNVVIGYIFVPEDTSIHGILQVIAKRRGATDATTGNTYLISAARNGSGNAVFAGTVLWSIPLGDPIVIVDIDVTGPYVRIRARLSSAVGSYQVAYSFYGTSVEDDS